MRRQAAKRLAQRPDPSSAAREQAPIRDVAEGTMDYESRCEFARKNGLPAPSNMDPFFNDGSQRFCIDVCSELNGVQVTDSASTCAPSSMASS